MSALPALMLALGLGLCGYYGVEWYQLPEYGEADLVASVELNLQLDLQRRGPHLQPDEEGLERMREMVRAEIESQIRREQETIQLRAGVGLVALVLGLSHLVFQRLTRTAAP
ncbi:MAG: hypothetical protein AB1651_16685 [Pseudomonadota bacterium]